MGKVFFMRKNPEDILAEHREILEEVRKTQATMVAGTTTERIIERIVERPMNAVEQEAVARAQVTSEPEPVYIPKTERAEVRLSVETINEDSAGAQESAAKLRRTRKKKEEVPPTTEEPAL